MKLYDSVVVICDNSRRMTQDANAIRTVLEAFGLRVYLYDLVQKRDALEVLAEGFPECEFVILCCHGYSDPNGGPQIVLEVIDQVDGDYNKCGGWEKSTINLTPANISDYFSGNGRTLLSIACGSGKELLAKAFLQADFKAYIAPGGAGVHTNSTILFVIGFFYHLLAATRLEDEPLHHTHQEAVSLAAQSDADYTQGTRAFHYYS